MSDEKPNRTSTHEQRRSWCGFSQIIDSYSCRSSFRWRRHDCLPGTTDSRIPQTTSAEAKTFLYMWAFGLNPVRATIGNTFAYLMNTFLWKKRKTEFIIRGVNQVHRTHDALSSALLLQVQPTKISTWFYKLQNFTYNLAQLEVCPGTFQPNKSWIRLGEQIWIGRNSTVSSSDWSNRVPIWISLVTDI